MILPFLKMHGLGNDFVILDARQGDMPKIHKNHIRAIGDRHFGLGFDQLVIIKSAPSATAALEFWNSDGSPSGACGNASRCVADFLMRETGAARVYLETERGILEAWRDHDLITVNMGHPLLEAAQIPVNADPLRLPIEGESMAVGMGNPHCVFFVDDANTVNLEELGPKIEHHPLFPARTNVEFVSLVGADHLRMRVWERGGMITLACGSGACAVAVAAHTKGITGRKVKITADGGDLWVEWSDQGVLMTGPVAYVARGVFEPSFLALSETEQ